MRGGWANTSLMIPSKGKCTWDELIPYNTAGWETALLKRCCGHLCDSKPKQYQQCVLSAIKATSTQQRSHSTVYSVLTRPHLDNHIQLLGPLIQERCQQTGAMFSKGPVSKIVRGASTEQTRRDWGRWACSVQKRESFVGPHSNLPSQMKATKKTEPDSLLSCTAGKWD